MKVSSNSGAATTAVSGFSNIKATGSGKQANLGSSNIASMQAGANVANQVLATVSELITAVKDQANKVTALASEIEARDTRDAGTLGGKQ